MDCPFAYFPTDFSAASRPISRVNVELIIDDGFKFNSDTADHPRNFSAFIRRENFKSYFLH
jgi:hypothetical protein